MKKILSLLLAILMVVTVGTTNVFAETTYTFVTASGSGHSGIDRTYNGNNQVIFSITSETKYGIKKSVTGSNDVTSTLTAGSAYDSTYSSVYLMYAVTKDTEANPSVDKYSPYAGGDSEVTTSEGDISKIDAGTYRLWFAFVNVVGSEKYIICSKKVATATISKDSNNFTTCPSVTTNYYYTVDEQVNNGDIDLSGLRVGVSKYGGTITSTYTLKFYPMTGYNASTSQFVYGNPTTFNSSSPTDAFANVSWDNGFKVNGTLTAGKYVVTAYCTTSGTTGTTGNYYPVNYPTSGDLSTNVAVIEVAPWGYYRNNNTWKKANYTYDIDAKTFTTSTNTFVEGNSSSDLIYRIYSPVKTNGNKAAIETILNDGTKADSLFNVTMTISAQSGQTLSLGDGNNYYATVANTEKTLKASDFEIELTNVSDTVNSLNVLTTSGSTYTISFTPKTNGGKIVPLNDFYSGNDLDLNSETASDKTSSLKIMPAESSATVTPATNLVYNGDEQVLATATNVVPSNDIKYYVTTTAPTEGQTKPATTVTWVDAPEATDAGTYYVYYEVNNGGNANYKTYNNYVTVIIAQKEVALPEATLDEITFNGNTYEVKGYDTLPDGAEVVGEVASAKNAGNYDTTYKLASANYKWVGDADRDNKTTSLTINKATATVTTASTTSTYYKNLGGTVKFTLNALASEFTTNGTLKFKVKDAADSTYETLVKGTDYTITSGSTVITLTDAGKKKLTAGKTYTFKFDFGANYNEGPTSNLTVTNWIFYSDVSYEETTPVKTTKKVVNTATY